MIDVHAHILPGIDDGPDNWSESITLCKALVADGITDVVATPHQLGRFGNESADPIRVLVEEVNQRLGDGNIQLTVHSGGEVRLDERIESLLEADKILTLANSKYLLLELLPEVAVNISLLIKHLVSKGVIPIIAHIERYPYYIRRPESASVLAEAGAFFQVTASSLVGSFGRSVSASAWHFLAGGNVVVVASDCHDNDYRSPQMTQAFEMIKNNINVNIASLLCDENPRRIVESKPLKEPFETDFNLFVNKN